MTAGIFAVVGLVAGLVVEHFLRRRGKVRREVRSWTGGSRGGRTESRAFEATFFNDKDVNVALWNPRVEFHEGGRLVASVVPMVRNQGPSGPIDLPSRTSVEVTLNLDASGDDLSLYRSAHRLTFAAAVVPRGLLMERKVVEPLKRWDD